MLLLVKYPYRDSMDMREPEIDDLELLERSCSMFVLRYLLHHPRKNKTEIMSTEGRNLTTKNRRIRIAQHLDEICAILDEIRPGMSEEGDVYIDPDADALMNHYRDNSR